MADKASGFVALFAIPLQHRTPLYLICLSPLPNHPLPTYPRHPLYRSSPLSRELPPFLSLEEQPDCRVRKPCFIPSVRSNDTVS